MELIEKALAAGPDAETYGMLMVNKAAKLNAQGKRDEAVKILGELIVSPDSTVATSAVARSLLAHMVTSRPQDK